jgi:hypothetical protein
MKAFSSFLPFADTNSGKVLPKTNLPSEALTAAAIQKIIQQFEITRQRQQVGYFARFLHILSVNCVAMTLF